jgi:hypothetical protein
MPVGDKYQPFDELHGQVSFDFLTYTN